MTTDTADKLFLGGHVKPIPDASWELNVLSKVIEFIGSGKTSTKSFGNFPLYGSTGVIGSCSNPEYSGVAILIARVGANAGTVNIVSGEYGVSDNTLILKFKSNVDELYFYYLLKSRNLNSLIFGSGQPLITGGQLKSLPVSYPLNKQKQTAIANALSDVDALIEGLEKLIAKKQSIKTATMQQLLTGKTRLPQFAHHPDGSAKGYKATELSEIPEGWELFELGQLLAYEQPTKYLVSSSEYLEGGSVPVLTAGKSFLLGYTEENYGIFKNLPVIIFDDFTTDAKLVTFPFKVKSSAIKMLKPRCNSLPIDLIYHLLQRVEFVVGDHKRHWISEFTKLKVLLPTAPDEQSAIATVLSDMDAEIEQLQSRLSKTRSIKQGMMQELLTGKTRLPLAAGA